MGKWMKTTIELADGLFNEAKLQAKRERITLRALLERSLRAELERVNARKRIPPFTLRNASFGAGGVSEAFVAQGGFARLRDIANER